MSRPIPFRSSSKRGAVLWKSSLVCTGIVLLVLLVHAWSLREAKRLVGPAVVRFHQQLNAGEFDAIYDETADAFKAVAKRDAFAAFMGRARENLGVVREARPYSITVHFKSGGIFIVTVYETTFVDGEAVETFTWVRAGNKVVLNGYDLTQKRPGAAGQ